MLAFAESGRKRDMIALLELLDLTKVSDSKYISNILKSLGRLELESYAEKLLQGMRSKGNCLCTDSKYKFDSHPFYGNKIGTSNLSKVICLSKCCVFTSRWLDATRPFFFSFLLFS
jgi:hypothetical protein